jgi:hypothetical protein
MYGDPGITETDSATGSVYLEDPGVDWHHLNIQNTHSIIPSSRSHALLLSLHGSKKLVWFIMVRVPSYPLTLFICSLSQNGCYSWIPFGCHARCGSVWGWLVCVLDPAFLCTGIEQVWRCILRPWSTEFGTTHGGRDCTNWETVIVRVWRYTRRLG